ncbi:MAG: hypothetical protein AAGI17_07690 [Planctomycetota bacterium]
MAEKPAEQQAETQDASKAPADAPKKGSPVKMIAIVAVLMLVEGIGVYGLVTLTSPARGAAAELALENAELAAEEQPVEIELAKGRYLNLQTGRAWSWRARIYVRAKSRNQTYIEEQTERNRVLIDEKISEVFARSPDRNLREPGRETLKRQLLAVAHEVFGTDADDEPRVDEVMIVDFQGNPIDY